MASLYILQSLSSRKFYTGTTVDLERRLAEHNRRHGPYTASRGPWKMVYREDYPTLVEARRRERQIKSWKSHRSITELISGKRAG